MDRALIKDRLMKRSHLAKAYAENLLTKEGIEGNLYNENILGYMCAKFRIHPEDIDTDDFYRICQISTNKAIQRDEKTDYASELASSCSGASSAMTKKILFILAIKKELKVEISTNEASQIESWSQLKSIVHKKLLSNYENGDGYV